jgi:branched-chain amino acid transport system permease protein
VRLLTGRTRTAAGIRSSLILTAIVVVLLVGMPAMSRYGVSLLTTLLLFVAAASAWNIIGGVAGQFSLASSAMIGIGSYTVIMTLRDVGAPVIIALVMAAALGAAFSVVIGVILFRLRGFYFTVGTLAVALAALTWMTTWSFTGATTGISAPLSLIPSGAELYLFAIGLAALALLASIWIIKSGVGLRMMAVRDDEEVADSLGVSPLATKMLALTVSGALTSAVGGVFALQKASVEPFSAFGLDWSITILVMAIVGGLGTVWGPAIGAVVIYWGLTVQLQSLPAISTLLAGILLILVIRFAPTGIVGAFAAAGRWIASRRAPHPTAVEV